MIKLKNEIFNSQEFIGVCERLSRFNDCDVKTIYGIYQFTKQLEDKLNDFTAIKKSLLDKYGEINEEKQIYEFTSDENNQKFNKDFSEFLKQEFEITSKKIKFPEKFKISAAEMFLFEDIFDFSNLKAND